MAISERLKQALEKLHITKKVGLCCFLLAHYIFSMDKYDVCTVSEI